MKLEQNKITFNEFENVKNYNELDNLLIKNGISFKTFWTESYKKTVIQNNTCELVILLPIYKENNNELKNKAIKIRKINSNYTIMKIESIEELSIFIMNNTCISISTCTKNNREKITVDFILK